MARGFNWEKANRQERTERARARPKPIKLGRTGDLPATPKQLAFLRRLGVKHASGLNRRQASALIDAKKTARAMRQEHGTSLIDRAMGRPWTSADRELLREALERTTETERFYAWRRPGGSWQMGSYGT